LREEDGEEYDDLLVQLTPILNQLSIRKEEEGPEIDALKERKHVIVNQISTLCGGSRLRDPPPTLTVALATAPLTDEMYVSPSVIEREAKASLPQRENMHLQKEAGTPATSAVVAVTQQGARKEKKGKEDKVLSPQVWSGRQGGILCRPIVDPRGRRVDGVAPSIHSEEGKRGGPPDGRRPDDKYKTFGS